MPMPPRAAIEENLAQLRAEIAEACRKANREAAEVRILAATKGRGVAEIKAAVEAGVDLIGENTVQEAAGKFEFLPPVEKHFIGHLQRNKAKHAAQLFDLIQSVDSAELAAQLQKSAEALGKQVSVLIEVNPTSSDLRYGLKPKALMPMAEQIAAMPNLKLCGLMAMLPYEDPETLRPHFRKMRELFAELKGKRGDECKVLSMGISHDFRVAVEEGSTLVRIGSRIFGPRGY